MKSIVTQRFIEAHKYLMDEGMITSSRHFALALNHLPQSMSSILNGKRDVTIELLRKAVQVFDINPNFLFNGERPILSVDEFKDTKSKVVTVVTNDLGDERIVHVPVSAQAGYGGNLRDPSYFKELPAFSLPDYRFKTGTHRCFDISGDSMEPTLFNGDKVVCSLIETEQWGSAIKDNFVYVIVTHTDVLIKRLRNKIKSSGIIELCSDNDFYDPIALELPDICEIWYVRVKISPFMPSPKHVRNALYKEIDEFKSTIHEQSRLISNLNLTIEKLLKLNRTRN